MGGRVPRCDVGCGECGRPQSGFGVVELDRSKSGASDRVDQSRALSCVCERNSRYGLRGVSIGEASHPGPPKRFARRDSTAVPSRQRSRSRCDTFFSSEEEPLVPSSRKYDRMHEVECSWQHRSILGCRS